MRTTIACLPVRDPERTLTFYRGVFGFAEAQIDEGVIALELPNLSLFLMEQGAFEAYSQRAGRRAQFPDGAAGLILSCAMETREAVDSMLASAPDHGGAAPGQAAIDDASGGYIGYVSDPDGHLWELVFPQPHPDC